MKHGNTLENSYHGIACRILEKNGAMRFRDLAREILKEKRGQGKTPEKTIYAILNRSIYIKREGYGLYSLKSEN